jgi:hypothetical protein
MADPPLHLGRQTCGGVRDQIDVAPRAVRRVEPAEIAAQVNHHHQQHAQVRSLNGGLELMAVDARFVHCDPRPSIGPACICVLDILIKPNAR